MFQIDAPGTVDRRHGAQAVGRALARPATSCSRSSRSELNDDRRRTRRRVSAAAAAGQPGPARAVRPGNHRFLRAARRPRRRSSCKAAVKSGMFIFLDTDLKIDNAAGDRADRPRQDRAARPEHERRRRRAGGMLGGGYVNYFSLDQRSYKVIPQVQQAYRLNTDQLLNYYVGSVNGVPIPLSSVATHHDQDDPADRSIISSSSTAPRSRASRRLAWRRPTRSNFLRTWPRRRCRRAMRSITAGCRGSTSRNRAALSPPSDLRSSSSSWRWPLCSRASAIRASFWCRCRCRLPAR